MGVIISNIIKEIEAARAKLAALEKAAALGYLGATGAELLEAQRGRKRRGKGSGEFMGIRGLEVDPP